MTRVVSALTRKLLRDLSRMRGQVVTIALVVACGIASFVTMQSAFDSLVRSRDDYYERYRFADVFAHLESAPRSARAELEALPGVARVATRIVEAVTVPIEGSPRPATGTVVSLPASGRPTLGAVHLVDGRQLDPSRSDEVLLLASFARAHGIAPPARLSVVLNGTRRELSVVGIAMSPEFVFTVPPGGLSYDPRQIAVLWMTESAVAAAFRMEGAFNDVLIQMQPGATERGVISALDHVLERHGGGGAVPRSKQPSHFMLMGELTQLQAMARVVPFLFLFVAAYLLNVVLARTVHLQRAQIATLKAVGYGDREVGLHYLGLVSVIVLIGAALGIALGAWLGRELTELYTSQYFHFPDPHYHLGVDVVSIGVGVSLGAAALGALSAVRTVARMPPAEAMRPPAPSRYRRSLVERALRGPWFGPSARMVVREVERHPLRVLLSALGIALAIGIVVVAGYFRDATDTMMDLVFHESMREDVTVTFSKPLPTRALTELEHLPGVWHAEGLRSVSVRLRHDHRFRDAALLGYPAGLELRRLVNQDGRSIAVPRDGVLLTRTLGEVLAVRPGDFLDVEVKEGRRVRRRVLVAGLLDEPAGLQGHMATAALHDLTREEPCVNTALLRVDASQRDAVMREMKRLPWVASVSYPKNFREQFDEQSGAIMSIYTFILAAFASVIAVGVVYNNARIALSQRSRDLASLRVLGFTRHEIASILFGELAVQILLAVPLGMWVGHQLVLAMAGTVDPETFRLPTVVSPRSYAFAVTVMLVASLVSFALVRRKLNSLDLIGVLKTRE